MVHLSDSRLSSRRRGDLSGALGLLLGLGYGCPILSGALGLWVARRIGGKHGRLLSVVRRHGILHIHAIFV